MKKYLLLISLIAAMAGCGGGGSSGGNSANNADSSRVQGGFDAFISYVASLISTGSDNAEPTAIEGVAATTPEETEPVPVM